MSLLLLFQGQPGTVTPIPIYNLATLGGQPTLQTLGGRPTITTLGGQPTITTKGPVG